MILLPAVVGVVAVVAEVQVVVAVVVELAHQLPGREFPLAHQPPDPAQQVLRDLVLVAPVAVDREQ
jgi:hypothetical protein